MRERIAVIGAGFGGLSVCHFASKNKNKEVHLFERNGFLGGQSSSMLVKDCFVEFSWRVFFDTYKYVDKIMKQVGILDSSFSKLSISHLVLIFLSEVPDQSHVLPKGYTSKFYDNSKLNL